MTVLLVGGPADGRRETVTDYELLHELHVKVQRPYGVPPKTDEEYFNGLTIAKYRLFPNTFLSGGQISGVMFYEHLENPIEALLNGYQKERDPDEGRYGP